MKKLLTVIVMILAMATTTFAEEIPYLVDSWSGSEQITDMKGTSSPEGTVLSWSAIPEAEGYLIGAIQNGQSYRQIGYVPGNGNTSYLDQEASLTEYSYYWVFPYKKVDEKVVRGRISTQYVYGVKQLPAPAEVIPESLDYSVRLSWTAVDGADGYVIKGRRGNGQVTVLGDTATTEFLDGSAPTDIMSFYWVYAYKLSGGNKRPGAVSQYVFAKSIDEAARRAQEEAARKAEEERKAREEAERRAAEEAARKASTVVSFRAQQLKALTAGNVPDASFLLVYGIFEDGHEEVLSGWSADLAHPVHAGTNNYTVTYNGYSGTISLYAEAAPVVQPQSDNYIINANSGVFHRLYCPSVTRMSNSNKRYVTASRDTLVSQGYQPCKNCRP